MKRDFLGWTSPSLGRRMEMLWFGHGGRPVLIFPTSMGRFFQNEDFGLVPALEDKVDAGLLQLICVDSVDGESWYNRAVAPAFRAVRHEQYDTYLRHEVLPLIWDRTGDGNVATVGASFGAYHAACFAGRHPGLVTRAVLFSGLYEVKMFLDGYWDERCYYSSPATFIANAEGETLQRLQGVEWVIATGEQDGLVRQNRDFADLLRRKGCPVHAEFWPGTHGHDWPFWNEAIRRFL